MVDHRTLNARPGAHVDADLLAGDAAQQIGREGEKADEDIRRGGCRTGHELLE